MAIARPAVLGPKQTAVALRRLVHRALLWSRLLLPLLAARIAHTLYRRHWAVPRSLVDAKVPPFIAFTGSGLLLAYYHGIATYLRDHFHVEDLRLSAISGGCTTIMALAMGIDLYQILLLGLHMKKWILQEGVYLNSFEKMVKNTCKKFKEIGMIDKDVEQLAAKHQCYIGVTQCFPPKHCSLPAPTTLRGLSELVTCSMNVVPFFSTPGIYQDRYYVDGGFTATWSVPEHVAWADVIKVTCMPKWCMVLPPAMALNVDIQPTKFMPTEMVVLYNWKHQQTLIRRGYEDAKRSHDALVARGLRPLPDAPLTEWRQWEQLFAGIDENNLPPLSSRRSVTARSGLERKHDELLRTYSNTDLHDALMGPRLRRLSRGGSQSDLDEEDARLQRAMAAAQ